MLKNPKKADLDKDGELSSYEKKRGMAIEANMKAKKGKMMKASLGADIKKIKSKKMMGGGMTIGKGADYIKDLM